MKNTVLSVEELNNLTVKELLELAKKYDIKGRHDMKKCELISHIEKVQNQTAPEAKCAEHSEQPAKQNLEQQAEQTKTDCLADEVEIIGQRKTEKTRSDYVNKLAVGQIIAFDLTEGKAMSAKVTDIVRSADENIKFVLCESKKGTKYKVPASKIIWVKTGKRFPGYVYDKLVKRMPDTDEK